MKHPTPIAPEFARLLTVAEVALHLQVSGRTVRRLITAQELNVVRVGKAVRVRPADLLAFVTAAALR